MKTKIFASYLPQYHEIEENNRFWGKGFTDWCGVKKATPQFAGHNQPRIPLNENYYDLSKTDSIISQAKLAKEYGVDGFNIYHYWFKNDHCVLQTPPEILLNNKEIDIEFFFTWDNNSWIRSWSNISGNDWAPSFDKKKDADKHPLLLECDYGDETAWKRHFDYLLPYFKDDRYLKIDEKPVFAFFTTNNHCKLKQMGDFWNELAIQSGFKGMHLLTQKNPFTNKHIFEHQFIYYPIAIWNKKRVIKKYISKIFHQKSNSDKLHFYDYKHVWRKIILEALLNKRKKIYFSGLVRYDDTPRRGNRANIIINNTPDLFYYYFSKLYRICCKNNKELVLLTAWNEWGEGAYLEPDNTDYYSYLNAIKKVVNGNIKNV